MKKIKFLIYSVLVLLIGTQSAFAYIDPGSGSLLVSAIVGMFITVAFSVKKFFYSFLAFVTQKKSKYSNDFSGKIVFFNEGRNYWRVFLPVLKEMEKSGQEHIYITADPKDPILEQDLKHTECYALDNMNQAILFMNDIKADVVIMTTVQLNILTLKRSKHVRHYSHLFHTPADIHSYKRFAFDYFDSILCCNEFQMESLRHLEKKRNKKTKQLYPTGCTYYDLDKSVALPVKKKKSKHKTVLLAPTWGEKSLLGENAISIIDNVISAGHKIIFRPHPQSKISDKEILEKINLKFGENPKYEEDTKIEFHDSLAQSDFVICDVSGFIYDCILLYRKPVVVWDVDWNKGGYEYYDIDKNASVLTLVKDAGCSFITKDNSDEFISVVNTIPNHIDSKINLSSHILNFKKAAPVAAKQIIEIHQEG